MDARALAGGSDSCAAAEAIVGAGPFAFDNTVATTGAEGQANASCLAAGQTGISNDVWFSWTAGATGDMTLSLCGVSGIDSKVAVYAGGGCPGGAALACNDDSCGSQSQATFSATAGNLYTIQLGTRPGAAAGQGSFTITAVATPGWDRGIASASVSAVPGSPGLYEIGFTATLASSSGLAPGSDLSLQVQVFLNQDPTPIAMENWLIQSMGGCDGIPYVCLTQPPTCGDLCCINWNVNGSAAPSVGDCVPGPTLPGLPGYCMCQGILLLPVNGQLPLFAGDSLQLAAVAAPGSLPEIDTSNDAYTFVVPSMMSSLCTPAAAGVVACPCANPPAGPDRGCDNSLGTGGASLASSGVASLSLDTLVFTTSDQMPTQTSIVLQGNAFSPTGVVFGAGVRCTAGSLKRLYIKNATQGSITAPGPGDAPVSVRSATLGDVIPAGAQRWYQVYYRDPGLAGCGTFNVTQTGEISWLP